MCNGELRKRAILEEDEHGGIRPAARYWNITHGMIATAINGGNSPTLRRLWGIPKHPPRHRLTIDCPPELKARFDQLRGEQSRADFMLDLLDCWQGQALLRY